MDIKTWQQMAWEDGCDPQLQPDPKHYTDEMQEEIDNLRDYVKLLERLLSDTDKAS